MTYKFGLEVTQDQFQFQAPLYPHRTLWRYTNAVLLLLLLLLFKLVTFESLGAVFLFAFHSNYGRIFNRL